MVIRSDIVRVLVGVGVSSMVSLLAACGTPHPGQPPTGATQGSLPLPPELPCRYPTQQQVVDLANASDSVVSATVSTGTTTPGPGGGNYDWSYNLSNVSVIVARPGGSKPAVVREMSGSKTLGLLTKGRYVLFLSQIGPSAFYVTNGFAGAFALTPTGAVRRECANYSTPSSPRQASGSPLSAQRLRLDIPSSLLVRPTPSKRSSPLSNP